MAQEARLARGRERAGGPHPLHVQETSARRTAPEPRAAQDAGVRIPHSTAVQAPARRPPQNLQPHVGGRRPRILMSTPPDQSKALADFLARHARAYDPVTDDYERPPFAADMRL